MDTSLTPLFNTPALFPDPNGLSSTDLLTPLDAQPSLPAAVFAATTSTPLQVNEFTPTVSGFSLTLSQDINTALLNLYDGQDASVDLPDLTLTGETVGEVSGSIVYDSLTRSLTFVKTGDPLAPDLYTLTLASREDSFVDVDGGLLDGNGDGTVGESDDYTQQFTIDPLTAPVLSVPDIIRGPAQIVDAPAAEGVPIAISDADGLTEISFDFVHDASLLLMTGVDLSEELVAAGWTLTSDLSVEGQTRVTVTGDALEAGAIDLVSFTTVVPGTATIGDSQILSLDNVELNGGLIGAIADQALQQVAYFGDANGSGEYTGLDASLIARVAVGLNSGFDFYDKTDPLLIGDTNSSGAFSGLDASFTARKAVGLQQDEIPDLPENLDPARITVFAPNNGEELVSLSREAIVRFSEPVQPETVTAETLKFISLGEVVPGRIKVSSSGEFVTFSPDQLWSASTEIRVEIDGQRILGQDGQPLDGNGDGLLGGQALADFRTVPLTRIEGTDVFGFIFDSNHTNPDGSNIPLVGVRVQVEGLPDVYAITDENGFFRLENVPAPEFYVQINPTEATSDAITGDGQFYAPIRKPLHSIAGQELQILSEAGEPFNIFLPLLAEEDYISLSTEEETAVGFGPQAMQELEEMFPEIEPEVWERLKVMIPPNSLTYDDGTPVTEVSVVPLPTDRIPAPVPEGFDPAFVFTVDARGATNVDGEAQLIYPNVDGLAPGEKRFIFSFDHDAGEWVPSGTATVSEDGSVLVSDEGSGVQTLGWRFLGREPRVIARGGGAGSRKSTLDKVLEKAVETGGLLIDIADLSTEFIPVTKFAKASYESINDINDFLDETGILSGGSAKASDLDVLLSSLDLGADILGNFVPLASSLSKGNKLLERIVPKIRTDDIGRITTEFFDVGESIGKVFDQRQVEDFFNDAKFSIGSIEQAVTLNNPSKNIFEESKVLINFSNSLNQKIKRDLQNNQQFPGSSNIILSNDTLQSIFETRESIDVFLSGFQDISIEDLDMNSVALPGLLESANNLAGPLNDFTLNDNGISQNRLFFNLINVDNGFEQRGQLDTGGVIRNLALSPDSTYRIEYFDSKTSEIGFAGFITGESGSEVVIPKAILQAPELFDLDNDGILDLLDQDGDGLSDLAELIIGTQIDRGDSDSDGLSDGSEIDQDLDPSENFIFPTGIIASVPLFGEAHEIVSTSIEITQQQILYIATGSHGLAIVDGSEFSNPIILSQLDLPGTSTDVDVDSQQNIAVLASGAGGLHIIDVSNPGRPVLQNTIETLGDVTRVELIDGIIYAAGDRLTAIDLLTGDQLQQLNLGSPVNDLTREGQMLYAITADNQLHSIDISGPIAFSRSSIVLPTTASRIFVGNGIAYVANGYETVFATGPLPDPRAGYATVDVTNPDSPVVLSDIDTPAVQAGNLKTVTNGSGLALVAAGFRGLQIHDAQNPDNTYKLVTEIATPGTARSVAIAAGIAYVADDTAGLQVINYLPFDNQGNPPTLTITSPVADLDFDREGIQLLEGTTIPVQVSVFDDVQVRNVELIVNGEVVRNEVSFPFDLSTIALTNDPAVDVLNLQVQATDTGGNIALSNVLTYELVPDTFAPVIELITPEDDQIDAQGLRRITVAFNEALNVDTINETTFQLLDAGGTIITSQNIQIRNNDQVAQFTYDPLEIGDYQFVIAGDAVRDRVGNPLRDSDVINNFSLVEATVTWVGGSGDWNNPNNWSTGVLPDSTDKVVINAPGDATITLTSGTASVASLITNEHLEILGGTLRVTEGAVLNQGLTFQGGTLDADGEVTLSGESRWLGGTLRGDAQVINIGDLILQNATLITTLTNSGTVTQTGTFTLGSTIPGTFNNKAESTFNLASGSILARHSFSLFNNLGLLQKTGEDVSIVDVNFSTEGGTIEVQLGILDFPENSTHTNSFYTIAENAILEFSQGGFIDDHAFNNISNISGEGRLRFTGNDPIIRGNADFDVAVEVQSTELNIVDNVSFNKGLTISSGKLNVFGDITLENDSIWINSSISHSSSARGQITNQGHLFIDSGRLGHASLTNTGTITKTGSSDFILSGTFNNLSEGLLDLQSGRITNVGNESLTNSGTIRKSGDEAFNFAAGFNNNGGSIEVQAGTLRFLEETIHTDSRYIIDSGALLEFIDDRHTFNGTLETSGTGQLIFKGNSLTQAIIADDIVFDVPVQLSDNAFLTVNGSASFNNGIILEGDSATPAIDADGVITLSGDSNWINGTFRGDQGVTNTGTLVISSGTLSTTLINKGTITKIGDSTLNISGNLNNQAEGILDLQTGSISGSGTIANTGTVQKNSESSVSISSTFSNNGGTIEIQDGTLEFTDTYAQTAGNLNLNGGTLTSSPLLSIQGGTLTGNGIINGNILNAGTINPGSTIPGTLVLNGNYIQTTTGTFQVDLGGTIPDIQYDLLQINGTATLDGTLDVSLIDDFVPVVDDRFDIFTFSSGTGNFSILNGLTLPSSLVLNPLLENNKFSLITT